MHHEQALPAGYYIGEYELVQVLGTGGFGITYLGYDTHLDIPVAIKEYLPGEFGIRRGDSSVVAKSSSDQSDFDWGLKSFLDEAKTLAKFKHPNLVQVHRYIETNHTAYIIMEYVEGDTLSERIKENQRHYSEQELKALLYPILDGLKKLHQQGIIHRDIKPANIIIRDSDESPVLIDFGAARNALGHKSKSITSVVSEGYSPIEQYYSSGEQGAWTDIYALGAVAYKCLTGEVPEASTARGRNDSLIPAVVKAEGQASASFLRGIDDALSSHHEDRPQTIDVWEAMLEGGRDDGIIVDPLPLYPGLSWKKIGLMLLIPITVFGLIVAQRDEQKTKQETSIIKPYDEAKAEREKLLADKKAAEEAARQKALLLEQQKEEERQAKELADQKAAEEAARQEQLKLEEQEQFAQQEREKEAAKELARQEALAQSQAKSLVEEADKYYFTIGDNAQAFKLYEQAAEQGSLSAKASLAKLWAMGRGTRKDMGKARDYSDQSFEELMSQAEMGFAGPQYQLGNLYTFVLENDNEALKWYRLAAEQDYANAQNILGWVYANGRGVGKNNKQASIWYRKAAEQGQARGQTNLGVMYYSGKGGLPESEKVAAYWLCEAAEQGFIEAFNNLDKMFAESDQEGEAFYWYCEKARQEDASVQNNNVPQSIEDDIGKIIRAAEQGDADAQNILGLMYVKGEGVARSDEQAVRWYRAAAEQGLAQAQARLAWMYLEGRGVTQSYEQAELWYRKAAGQGDALAQIDLGIMYEEGKGVTQNYDQAEYWYRKAAEQGNSRAQNKLDNLCARAGFGCE